MAARRFLGDRCEVCEGTRTGSPPHPDLCGRCADYARRNPDPAWLRGMAWYLENRKRKAPPT